MKLAGLNWIERWALRILHGSPRIGLLVVKRNMLPLMAYSVSSNDAEAVDMAMALIDELEPPSLQLERLYHAPAYGEDQ